MGASQFEQSAGALKNKFWLKNLKARIIFAYFFLFEFIFGLNFFISFHQMMIILGIITGILAIVVIGN